MKFFVKTFGCQMNVNDSEKIRHILETKGLAWTDREDEADLVVVNSCAVRQKPEEKIFSYIGRCGSRQKVILAGCVGQLAREGAFAHGRSPDWVVGTHQFHKIGEIALRLSRQVDPGLDVAFSRRWQELIPSPGARSSTVTAFVPVMEGCDNFCSYCVVPFTRGREKHRPFRYVMREAELLSRQGYKEIVLLGQNVNAWRDEGEKMTFPGLLAELGRNLDFRWIRFITSYPGYHDPRLVEVMSGQRRLAQHIHFPAQSGSSRILGMMERDYSRASYLEIIRSFRRAMPGFAFSSDFIVGFPGETERDFSLTLSLLEAVKYESVFSFVYSPRPLTRAYRLADGLPLAEKMERLYRLQQMQSQIQLRENLRLVGKELEVLVSGRHPKKPQEVIGRSETYRVVNFASTKPAGQFCRVEITAAGPHSLRGREVEGSR